MIHFVVHDDGDSVGVVVVEGVKAGDELTGWIMDQDREITFQSVSDIPIGHKLAIKPLKDGDTVALIPPIAGGELPPFLVTEAPLEVQALRDLVMTAASGAAVVFEGVVRDHHEGREVLRLEYEAYVPMAEKVIGGILDEVEGEYAGVRACVHHRTGDLALGDRAVVVAVSSPHRADAFAACAAGTSASSIVLSPGLAPPRFMTSSEDRSSKCASSCEPKQVAPRSVRPPARNRDPNTTPDAPPIVLSRASPQTW